jgi:hypothetical protein
MEIQQNLFQSFGMGFGGSVGGRGLVGDQLADPGVCIVKMTVDGKTLTGKITVRQDPMLDKN